MTGADKRVFPRFVCQLTVELQTRSGPIVTGVSRNLSRGGICLETVDPVTTGEDVAVRVTLVFDEERSSEPLELPAQVVWCTSFGDAYQIGTQFRPLSQDRAQYLDMFLRYLEQHSSSSDDVGDSDDDNDPFAA
ncbi:MAG TPA: PilZ domain-containing protein [Kofleriaceae bacterium]